MTNFVMHPEHSSSTTGIIPIQDSDGVQAVMGRDLHAFLEVGRDYTNWFKDMCQYGFSAGQDFTPISAKTSSAGGRPRIDHIMSLDMAKEISMIQRTERGKQARQYFIECERKAQAHMIALPQTYAEALEVAAEQARRVEALETQKAIDAPKIDYHNAFVTDEDLLSIRTVASTLGLKEKTLRDLLLKNGWIYAESATRWSQSQGKKVTWNRYSEYARVKKYFRRVEHHDIPRFKGEVMHSLKVTPEGAAAIARLVHRSNTMEVA